MTSCAAHRINLIMEEIGKRKNVVVMIKECRGITRFIHGHSRLLSLMMKYTNNHALMHPGSTRFATHFIALESLVMRFKTELIQMFALEE